MSRTIYLLRHGQTEFNRERRMQGHCDSPLTNEGIAQARLMGATLVEILHEPKEWQVLVSPLGRARQTAQLVMDELGLSSSQLHIEQRLIEVAFGEWEMQRVEDVFAQFPELASQPDWYFQAPDCEPFVDVVSRLEQWLSDPALPQKIIVVAHGLLGRILRGIYADLSPEALWQQDMPQDAFFRLQDGVLTRIECVQYAD
ncbi:MAG: histidine phosphatase family protein [Deefgea sp.]